MPATYEPIATTTLGSAAASITFSSIPATYTDLRLVFVGTTTTGGSGYCRFNSDSGSNYSATYLRGDGSTASSARSSNYDRVPFGDGDYGISTSVPELDTIDIFSYAGSTNKTCLVTISPDKNGSGTLGRTVSLWRNTAAITSITLTNGGTNWATGTTATLYGIKNA